ncbi:MAG TPA: DUF6263 family protein [Bacteroidales bacterium]|nr:DUF6263 family protein [Bacteroidales bacterium]
MKSILSLLIGFALLTSCQPKKNKLELNLTKGTVYYQKMTSDVTILQNINGQQLNTKMSINARMSYKVTNIQNDVYDMEVRYESLIMKMGLPSGEMEFSSEKNDERDILSSILGTMKNKPFMIKMTKTGKVNEVKGIESVFSNMFEKFPQVTEEQKQQVLGQIQQAYGEKAFKGNFEMCSAIFPDNIISKGDKWIIKTQLESGMSAKMETVYELKEITDNYYQILGDSRIETTDKDAHIESNGMPLKYDLKGAMTSDIKIDKKTGWTMDAVISQSLKGTAIIKDNPQMPGGMAIPMTMNNEMTISDK